MSPSTHLGYINFMQPDMGRKTNDDLAMALGIRYYYGPWPIWSAFGISAGTILRLLQTLVTSVFFINDDAGEKDISSEM